MADGKITIETSIDKAGALKDLDNLNKKIKTKGKEEAENTASSFSLIGKAAKSGVKVAAAAIGSMSAAMSAAGGYAIKTGIDFESAFAGVKKTVDAPKEVIDGLRQSLIDMSKVMPQSASELSGIAEAAGQLGIETSNIESFTKTMARLGDSTNMAATEAADSLARFANITGMSQADFDRLGSVIVSLGNNMATTESEITEMGMRLAGAGHQVGMTEAQIMSFSAALSSVGIEAEAGGSAFSTIMSKMQLAAENGGESLNNFASVAGMSAEEFRTAFQKDAAGVIISFVKGLSDCEKQGKSAIGVLDDMGITEIRQRDALLRAAGASDVFSKALQIGADAWDENTALANEAAQRYETLESKLSMMKNSVQALGIQFKDYIDGQLRDAVQAGSDSINRLADAFTNGGLDAAVSEAGDTIADLSVRIAGSAPDMIQAASSLLKSFVNGISSRKSEIIAAGIEVAESFAEGVADLLPSSMAKPAKEAIGELAKSMKSGGLSEAASSIVNVFEKTATLAAKALKPAVEMLDLLADNFDKIAPIAAGAYVAISGKGKIDKAITSVQDLVKGVQKMTSWYQKAKKVTMEYALQQEIATYTGRARTIELTAGQAVVGLFTGKVQLATAAQTIWNTVTAANPIGLEVREKQVFPLQLIVANEMREELGLVKENIYLDLDIGETYDFEIRIDMNVWQKEKFWYNHILFVPDTEYGGIMEDLEVVTKTNEIVFRGDTWRGMLRRKVVEPPDGNRNLILNGELNAVIRQLVGTQFSGLFVVDDVDSGISVQDWPVDRYVLLYDAILKLVENFGYRLQISYVQGKGLDPGVVHLRAVPVVDWSGEIEYSQDSRVHFGIRDSRKGINHLVCAGTGRNEERIILHLYVQEDGSIGRTQYYFGLQERAAVYEFTSADAETLLEYGTKQLKELQNYKRINLSVGDMELELGDIVGGRERVTGIVLNKPITRKILKISKKRTEINYEIKGDD